MKFPTIVLTLALAVLTPWILPAQVPWRLQAGVGLTLPSNPGAPMEPFVETAAFARVLETAPPEYFQAGGRLAWDSRGVTAAVGVRHKLYFLPWSSSGQEVLVGRRFLSPTEGSWTLGGRFGLAWPFSGSDGSLPDAGVDLVWEVDWDPDRGIAAAPWGMVLGLGLGQGLR